MIPRKGELRGHNKEKEDQADDAGQLQDMRLFFVSCCSLNQLVTHPSVIRLGNESGLRVAVYLSLILMTGPSSCLIRMTGTHTDTSCYASTALAAWH